jgi:hypothetical protein
MDGHPFYLRSLTRRQAGIDEISDEIGAIWGGLGRFSEILQLCDAAEPSMGPDAFLERRFSALYRKSYDRQAEQIRDAAGLRESLLLAERAQKLDPRESGYSIAALHGWNVVLKDVAKAREVAGEMLRNPWMADAARQSALSVLREQK